MPPDKQRPRSRSRRRDTDRDRSYRHRDRSRTHTPAPPRSDLQLISTTLNSILSRINALETNSDANRPVNGNGRTNALEPGPAFNSTSVVSDIIPCPSARPVLTYDGRQKPAGNPEPGCKTPAIIITTDVQASERVTSEQISLGIPVSNNSNVNSTPCTHTRESLAPMPNATQDLIDALKSFKSKPNQNYFVSKFDPAVHDIDDWCKEVERAKLSNGWDDYECLSRVADCLIGDARTWLHDWVSNDRSWNTFIQEFKTLCPRRLDYASILYNTMNTNSDNYATYAEYARRTLLRLKVVKGLGDELMVLIIIRGISDAQIKAAAANANLTCDNIVSFLSIYVKHKQNQNETRTLVAKKRSVPVPLSDIRCYHCGQMGHKSFRCPKKPKMHDKNETSGPVSATTSNAANCTFCKKSGHTEQTCFAKNRSGPRNKRKVNLCAEQTATDSISNDITTAVIQGVPIDVLIDSGALNVSLISSDALKHFGYKLKPVNCTLRGIGGQDIVAEHCVTLTIEFSEISVEADLIVVPAKCISFPIIIGTDILNRDGITFVRTKDRQYLTHSTYKINHVSVASSNTHTHISTPLQGQSRESLMSVLDKYSDFLITGTASSTVKTGNMKINLTDQTAVAYRPYKLSHQEKLKVREIIADLMEKGIIRESTSQYASPIILVKKKDGSDRMCVDYRALNRRTVRDRYPLPLIDDHIDRLGKAKYFTSLDMATGFHQIPIDEESIHKTGFVTPEGHFEYLKMPYGLTNSPIVYQRIINETLRTFIEEGSVLVYIDDVLLMSSTVEEGIELLKRVLSALTEAGFSINIRKCSFLATEVEYLGRLISRGQVRPSPHKVEALVKSSPPSNVKQVRQFLGLAGYFRRYIEGYATRTACISGLLKNNTPFKWGLEQETARQDIITRLTTEPILSIFDPNLKTEVHTDASSLGYGAILLQIHQDGKKRVVAYFSKGTHGAESRYHSYELETLAVVRALSHFRHYLMGIKFKIVTDCNAIKATEKKKDLLPRVARWWVYLQDFTFEVEYRKGTMMSHADYLSRNPIAGVNHISRPRNWAQMVQAADSETEQLRELLQDGQLDSSRYIYQNDMLYYRYKTMSGESKLLCYVPKGYRLSLLRIFHDEHEHVGTDKTVDLILQHFWFPGLRQFVRKYLAHCLICISMKRVQRAPHQYISSWSKPGVPFDTLHMDALGPLPLCNGNKFILVVVDAFSKYCLLYPMKRQVTDELITCLSNVISLFGVPKLLVTDRGRMFIASHFVKWIKEMGSDIHYITPDMHHSNGQAERYMRTLLNMVRIEANYKNTSWPDGLWKLQLVLNITKQRTTQTSPMNLLIGVNGTTPVIRNLIRDLATENAQANRTAWRDMCRVKANDLLKRNQEQQDARANAKRHPARVFQVGDLVFAIKYSQSTGKLDPGMRGPYKVIKALPEGRYELRLLSGSYGKTTQSAAQYMVLWPGEWCPESCASFFENDETLSPDPDAELQAASESGTARMEMRALGSPRRSEPPSQP